MTTFAEIAAAAAALPEDQKQRLVQALSHPSSGKKDGSLKSHSVMDIAAVSVGQPLRAFDQTDDILGEMLEQRD